MTQITPYVNKASMVIPTERVNPWRDCNANRGRVLSIDATERTKTRTPPYHRDRKTSRDVNRSEIGTTQTSIRAATTFLPAFPSYEVLETCRYNDERASALGRRAPVVGYDLAFSLAKLLRKGLPSRASPPC